MSVLLLEDFADGNEGLDITSRAHNLDHNIERGHGAVVASERGRDEVIRRCFRILSLEVGEDELL